MMIFYFTATGNSLYAAKKLDENLISIPKILNSERLCFSDEKIGIVCPVYGHEMPKMVKEFLSRAEFNTDYLYLVLTYGARHGNAVELAEDFLKSVQKQADYITTLLMADNFLPVFDMAEQAALDKGTDENLAAIKHDIIAKKRFKQAVSEQDRAIHKMYQKSVNFADETLWTDFSVEESCIGCGICTKVCPAGCISLLGQKAVHSAEGCQACYGCIHACPRMAITLKRGEKNKNARYRCKNISLSEIVASNNQTEN